MTIYISPANRLQSDKSRLGPCHVILIRDPNEDVDDLLSSETLLRFNDIDFPDAPPTLQPPTEHHILSIVRIAKQINAQDNLIISCHAGISRSPAAFLIAHFVQNHSESGAIQALITKCPLVIPNPIMLSIADGILKTNLTTKVEKTFRWRVNTDPEDIF